MKIEISPWSHVETSFTVPDVILTPTRSNDDDNDIDDVKKVGKTRNIKSLRKSPTLLLAAPETTSPVVELSADNNDITFGFIEHTKSSLSYYHHHHSNTNRSNSSRKRRKVSSTSKRMLVPYHTDEEISEDRIPVMTVSSPNQIAVMVEEENVLLGHHPSRIQESSILQFHHHSSTAAVHPTKKNLPVTSTTTTTTTPKTIPPIYDIHNQRMYAVQSNNTKIICHYYNDNRTATDPVVTPISTPTRTKTVENHTNHSTTKPFRHDLIPQYCEVTFPCDILSLSILYLPETNHHPYKNTTPTTKPQQQQQGIKSVLFGTCANSKLFIVQTTLLNPKDDTFPSSSSPAAANLWQLTIQYFDTPYTIITSSSSSPASSRTNINALPRIPKTNPTNDITVSSSSGIENDPQHAGTVAVLCPPIPTTTVTTQSGKSGSRHNSGIGFKKRSIDTLTTTVEQPPTTSDDCSIVCFYQVFYTRTNHVQVVRQHIRFVPEPPPSTHSMTMTTTNQQLLTVEKMTHASLYSDQQHTNSVTPIHIHHNHPRPITDLTVLGSTTSGGANDENNNNNTATTLVLSYRSLRHAASTAHGATTHPEMNGSSKHMPSTTSTTPPQYDSFYGTLSANSRRVLSSSLSTFPFVLPYMDDAIQQTCLVGPSMIGVLTQRYQQIYLYDLYRGGLIHMAQPFSQFTANAPNNGTIPITCISLLADIKRSKMAVTYMSHGNPKKYCIAYASFGLQNGNHRNNNGPMSLADGLVAATAASTMSYGAPMHASMRMTRTLFPDVSKLSDLYQNEMMVPQQTAMQNAIQLFYDACEKIKNANIESSQPSFLVKIFDAAMQSVCVDGGSKQHASRNNGTIVPTNGIKSENLHDSLPLKDIEKNGEKMMNGFHKKNDIVSPTTLKEQLYNGSGKHHQSEQMNGSLKTRPKHSHYQLTDMPQILIDMATGTMVAILNLNLTDSTTAHSIRNDARVLLRRLIRTGKVSARAQLNVIPTGNLFVSSGSSRFMQLLRSLELSRAEYAIGEVWSSYTPFDLICDMIDHCTDISERQMVVALRYTLFNTRPVDIASYFVRNKNVNGAESLRKLGSDLLLALKQDEKVAALPHKSHKEKLTLLQHKMVVAGTAFMICRITKASIGFNVALLRSAFEAELDLAEFEVLVRLVLEMLSDPDKFQIPPSSNMSMKNLLQLVVTLCDCLSTLKRESGSVDAGTLPRMEHLLSMVTAASGRILSMQKLLQDSIIAITRNAELSTQRQTDTNQPVNTILDRLKPVPTPTAALPPYQIERLLF